MQKIDIINYALSHLGQTTQVASLSDGSVASRVIGEAYDHVRRDMLSSHEWKFSTQHGITLATASADPPSQWGYAYAFPTNAIAVFNIEDTVKRRNPDDAIEFQVAYDNENMQRIIYCDEEDATAVVCYDVDNETLWPPYFTEAFSWRLASRLAMPITGDVSMMQYATQGFAMEYRRATAADANSDFVKEPDPSYIQARL